MGRSIYQTRAAIDLKIQLFSRSYLFFLAILLFGGVQNNMTSAAGRILVRKPSRNLLDFFALFQVRLHIGLQCLAHFMGGHVSRFAAAQSFSRAPVRHCHLDRPAYQKTPQIA